MRKMVNSMSAKMEIGSPMASMYLLGNPDHYTSHNYVPFAWRQYVQFVRTSAVDDYRYRPAVYSNLTLYEWIQCSKKKKRSVKERAEFEEEIELTRSLRPEYNKATAARPGEDHLNTDDDDPLEDDPDEDGDYTSGLGAKRPVQHPFLPTHPMFNSHSVNCDFENLYRLIPNFIGGSVPRSDKGDRAAYCMTMLTLFKPWRSPADLKDSISTWDQAFKEHTFTERQNQLITNFDVRYECNDARDDHYAQMRKKLNDAKKEGKSLWPAGFMGYKDKFADDLNDFDYGSDDDGLEDIDEDVQKGPRTLKMIAEAKDIRNIMQTSGWLEPSVNGLNRVDTD
ncbi:hypothetical protein C8R46DRAFT_1295856, partial [Mycena filopes]